jgi:RNA polymerase sigma factor (sigma-70 family)
VRRSLSRPIGSFPAPNKEEPVELMLERDRVWLDGLTADQYRYYYEMALNRAFLIVGNSYEAEVVADKVMDELREGENPPSKGEVEVHLRVLVRSRALDCLRSLRHRIWVRCRSLVYKGEDGEEYEGVPASHCSKGAEEEFFYEQDRELFARRYAQVVSGLGELERVCFVLRRVEGLKPAEIAEILEIPAEEVSTHAYRARNRIAKLLGEQEAGFEKCGKRGKGASQ